MEILLVIFFLWLSFKFLGLAFRMAWCVAKVAASVLFALAVPLLVLCLVFAGFSDTHMALGCLFH